MSSIEAKLSLTTRFLAGITAVISALAIIGWLTNSLELATIKAVYIPMAPATAGVFLIFSAVLVIAPVAGEHARWRLGALIAVSFASLLAAAVLTQYLGGFEIDIERFIITAPTKSLGRIRTGRMSPITAAMFLMAAAGLWSLLKKSRAAAFGAIMGSLVLTASSIILIGYLFGVPFFYGGKIIPVALTAALAFTALGIGLVIQAGPGVWPLRALVGTGVQARILRAFLPMMILVVLTLEIFETFTVLNDPTPLGVVTITGMAIIITVLVTSVLSRLIGRSIEHAEAERRRREDEINYIIFHDTLTGLPNRDYVLDTLGRALKIIGDEDRPIAVMHLNIDGFKLINEAYGRETGNNVIKTVASRLMKRIQSEDTLGRVGADEFFIILVDTDTEDALKAAQAILLDLATPIFVESEEIRVTAGVGISLFPDDDSFAEKLIANAETASRQAKKDGRNKIRYYTPELQVTANNLLVLENELIHAVEREEIVVYYQPVFELKKGGIASIEALARWAHPKQGLLSPDKFIPFAEESGLIVPIGTAVMREACRQLKIWHRDADSLPAIAVNVSAVQLDKEGFASQVKDILEETGLSPDHLIIELTESSIIHNLKAAKSVMAYLTTLGASVALDDFGTGYASMATLIDMPVKIIKIDRSFISGMTSERKFVDIVKTIIAMAHNLGLSVVAEGVETQDQLDILSFLECDTIQGFLLSRPLSAAEMGDLIKEKNDFLKKSA